MRTVARHTRSEQTVIWHDVECGGYSADLPFWRALAANRPGPVLELGCGTGRVSLDLARSGTPAVALDHDHDLVQALRSRAAQLPLEAVEANMLDFDLGRRFGLIAAPMQVIQLLAGTEARITAIRAMLEHLRPGGAIALAVVEGAPEAAQAPDYGPGTLPDIAEHGGWVYSSLPLGVEREAGAMIVHRLRQVVSPFGEMSESRNTDRLSIVSVEQLEDEAAALGLDLVSRIEVPATSDHIGSLIVVLEEAP